MRKISITFDFEIDDDDFNSESFQEEVIAPIAGTEAEESMTEDWPSIRGFESKIEVK
jgi:hypothetical protein